MSRDESRVEVVINDHRYMYRERAGEPREIRRAIPPGANEYQTTDAGELDGFVEYTYEPWEIQQFDRMLEDQRSFMEAALVRPPAMFLPPGRVDRDDDANEAHDAEEFTLNFDRVDAAGPGEEHDGRAQLDSMVDSDGWITSDDDDDDDEDADERRSSEHDSEEEADELAYVSENSAKGNKEFSYMERHIGGPMMKNFHPFAAHAILSNQEYHFLMIKSVLQLIAPETCKPFAERNTFNLETLHKMLLFNGARLEIIHVVAKHKYLEFDVQYKFNDNNPTEQDDIDTTGGDHRTAKNTIDLRGIISDFCLLKMELVCFDADDRPIRAMPAVHCSISEHVLLHDEDARKVYNARIKNAEFAWFPGREGW